MNRTAKKPLALLMTLVLCAGMAAPAYSLEPEQDNTVYTESELADAMESEISGEAESIGDDIGQSPAVVEGSADGEEPRASPVNSSDAPVADPFQEHEEQSSNEAETEQYLPEDIVYDEAELTDWLSDHSDSGGRVKLGATITLIDKISVYGSGRIIIDTGPHGLVYDGGSIYINEWEIIGEGVDVPVLDVRTVIKYGSYWEASWNDVLQSLNITATGRDGTGGIAVRIRQDDGYSARFEQYFEEGLIRAYGTGAIGLYLDEPLSACCFRIDVEGDYSTCVYAPQGATLYYCKLTAEGAGASVVSGSDEIVLDTCAASPEPQNAQVINYRIIRTVGSRFYYPVQQYADYDIGNIIFYIPLLVTFLLRDTDGNTSVMDAFPIEWEYNFIDTNVLGYAVVQGYLFPPFQELGLEDDFPLTLTVDVRDPEIPCISDIWFDEDMELGIYVDLSFWDTYERDDENVILWRSDDGGESWYDFTDSPDIEWCGDRIYYYYGKISSPVMLQLEVLGKGVSNVVTLYSTDGKVYSGMGGDRTGTDRVVVDSGDKNGSGNYNDGTPNGDTIDTEEPADSDDVSSGNQTGGRNKDGDTGSNNSSGGGDAQTGDSDQTQSGSEDSSGAGDADNPGNTNSGDGSPQAENDPQSELPADNGSDPGSDSGSSTDSADKFESDIQAGTGNGGTFIELQDDNVPLAGGEDSALAAAGYFVEKALTDRPVTEDMPAAPEPNAFIQAGSADIPSAEEHAATASAPEPNAPINITQRSAAESTVDMKGGIIIAALAAALLAVAFILRRARRARGRRV